MLKLRHNLLWQASEFFLYFWYTICVAGMACDILNKDKFLRVGMINRQHLPITVIIIQEKKCLTSAGILWQSNSKALIILWDYVL